MASRRPSRSRKSARRRRSSGEAGHGKWYLVIAVCAVLLVGVGVASTKLIATNAIDEKTLCHRAGQLNATAILLDLTDPLSKTQQARLKTMIGDEIVAASVDTMVALGVVSESANKWGVRFAKCRPETGKDASALYQNPQLIAERYDKEFLQPLQAILASVINGESENQSPIMEALQALIAETPRFSDTLGRRKIIIVSDMLQHSDTLSFYRGQGWEYFAGTGADARLAGTLRNAEVEILRIPRTGTNIPSNNITEDFWTRYFDRQGSLPPIVRSLGDL